MSLNVDDICTDADLLNRAGASRLKQAKSEISERDAARATALREVVLALQGRSPPIAESQLVDPTELRDVVTYRALQILFENAMGSVDGLHAQLAGIYAREYAAASKRSYTVSGGLRGPSGGSFRMERR
jgi:hypothetical protein